MAKVKITYRAGAGDPVSVPWHGKTFVSGHPVEFDDELDKELIGTAKGNPSFDVGDESKSAKREEAAQASAVAAAETELAVIENAGAEIAARHETEANEMEARHQRERDAWLNANQQRAEALRAVIRGSDGKDDHELQPQPPSTPAPAAAAGGKPVEPAPPAAPPSAPPSQPPG